MNCILDSFLQLTRLYDTYLDGKINKHDQLLYIHTNIHHSWDIEYI